MSSCETLLLLAGQSGKTVLVGENSGGYVGYGNMFSTRTPCLGFELQSTTTRYKDQHQFEVVGIAPDVSLTDEGSWVEQAVKIVLGTQEPAKGN